MPEEKQAPPNDLVLGKYRLTQLIGRGGMGSVWEGVHATLGTRVAIKFIDSEFADSDEARRRFENEARAAAALKTKHVVKVFDHGLLDDGRPYIVMEYLVGEPLDRRLERCGRLSLADTASIVLQVSRALSKAHQAGIVHRDLKPENIFLVWDEEDRADIVKVVDFGIAKFTEGSVGVSSSTRTGSVLGTPQYMSPEQARGLRGVDHRSDLWSLGVIAYRAVVGRLPFDGEAIGDLLVKICTAPLPIPSKNAPGIPSAFDTWFSHALERDPERRFASAAELADALCDASGVPARRAMPSAGLADSAAASEPAAAAATVQASPFGVSAAATVAPTTAQSRAASSPSRGTWVAISAVFVLAGAGVGLAFALGGHPSKHRKAAGAADRAARSSLVVSAAPAPSAPARPVEQGAASVPSASALAPPEVAPASASATAPTSASASARASSAPRRAVVHPRRAKPLPRSHVRHADKGAPINLGY